MTTAPDHRDYQLIVTAIKALDTNADLTLSVKEAQIADLQLMSHLVDMNSVLTAAHDRIQLLHESGSLLSETANMEMMFTESEALWLEGVLIGVQLAQAREQADHD